MKIYLNLSGLPLETVAHNVLPEEVVAIYRCNSRVASRAQAKININHALRHNRQSLIDEIRTLLFVACLPGSAPVCKRHPLRSAVSPRIRMTGPQSLATTVVYNP
jgi:hypothetical protein